MPNKSELPRHMFYLSYSADPTRDPLANSSQVHPIGPGGGGGSTLHTPAFQSQHADSNSPSLQNSSGLARSTFSSPVRVSPPSGVCVCVRAWLIPPCPAEDCRWAFRRPHAVPAQPVDDQDPYRPVAPQAMMLICCT